MMTPEEALERVKARFPIPDYIPDDSGHANVARTVQRYLPPGAQILDFGCGPCDKTAVLQELGYSCTGYDDLADPWHSERGTRERILEFARSYGIKFETADASELPFRNSTFDMVMMHDVVEHLHDSPRDLINDLIELIVPGGYLFITVPNAGNLRKRLALLFGGTNAQNYAFYYWSRGSWRGHVREYVRSDLAQLASYLGLSVCELRSCHNMVYRVPKRVRLVYRAATAVAQGWRDTWLLVAQKPPAWQPRTSIPDTELKSLLGQLKWETRP